MQGLESILDGLLLAMVTCHFVRPLRGKMLGKQTWPVAISTSVRELTISFDGRDKCDEDGEPGKQVQHPELEVQVSELVRHASQVPVNRLI